MYIYTYPYSEAAGAPHIRMRLGYPGGGGRMLCFVVLCVIILDVFSEVRSGALPPNPPARRQPSHHKQRALPPPALYRARRRMNGAGGPS